MKIHGIRVIQRGALSGIVVTMSLLFASLAASLAIEHTLLQQRAGYKPETGIFMILFAAAWVSVPTFLLVRGWRWGYRWHYISCIVIPLLSAAALLSAEPHVLFLMPVAVCFSLLAFVLLRSDSLVWYMKWTEKNRRQRRQ